MRRYVRELDNITVKYGDAIVMFSFHFNSCFEMICNAPELDERGQGIVLCSVSEGTLNCVSHNKVLPLQRVLVVGLAPLEGYLRTQIVIFESSISWILQLKNGGFD